MDINLLNQECFQKISNIGYNKIINICSGKESVIPWGSADWFTFGVIIIFGIFATSMLIFFIKELFFD